MNPSLKKCLAHFETQKNRYLKDLMTILSFPSVSTQEVHQADMYNCANYLNDYFLTIGLDSQVHETPGHPIVFAQTPYDSEKKTILIYGHYDVQPPDPLSLWNSDPFKAEVKKGHIIARGASDDKGQFFCHIAAIESIMHCLDESPVNIKFLLEGEEEIGSPHLPQFVANNKTLLRADIALISDTPMYSETIPSICYSLRGLLYTEVVVRGPNHDLHSGQLGGVVQNPIQTLSNLISMLKTKENRVSIPGFYDTVLPLSTNQASELDALAYSDASLKKELGVAELAKEKPFDTPSCLWFRPTLDCNGIEGGYIGEGAKTIIPSLAKAKISMRLVADQDPKKIFRAFKKMLIENTPKSCYIQIKALSLGSPYQIDRENPMLQTACKAIHAAFGKYPILQGEGGSIPITTVFKNNLNLDTILMGFNLPTDRIHSPNERFSLDHFYKGIHASLHFLLSNFKA